jgi:hypothetical protein
MHIGPLSSKLLAFLCCAALLGGAHDGIAAPPAPYTVDAVTKHLWHLDEAITPNSDAALAGIPFAVLTNAATLGTASLSGFGSALDTTDGGSATNAASLDAYLSVNALANNSSADNVPWSFDDPDTGAFTFEAIVRIGFDPAANLGPVGTGRNLPLQILSGDQDSGGGGVRSWQLRLDPVGFNPNTDGVTSPLTQPALEFININNGSGVQSFVTLLPVTGPDAIASNQWYHVAVAYDGNDASPDNLRIYWTLIETNRTAASVLASRQMNTDLNDGGGVDLCIGNTGRTIPNNNFIGLIDEVRISGVARGSNEFVFRSVTLAGASGWQEPNVPANTLDGSLLTRWSAQGDGQWITYDLGRIEQLDAVDIAFYQGNTRTTSFDVLLSNDNTSWWTALAGAVSSGASLDLETFALTTPLPARYVRIVGHGNSQSDWNSLTEVSIQGSAPVDMDNDTLPDEWEIFFFGDLDESAADDPDADLLSNVYEFHHSSNPTNYNAPGDSDNDALPDIWEETWFGGLSQTGEDDPDRDNRTNLDEFNGDSNPTDPNSVPGDIDGDGLGDTWEQSSLGGTAPGAYEDTDNDGYHNLAELLAGTQPLDANAHPNWRSPRVAWLRDSVVVTNACLMPANSTYGRAINGISYQNQPLLFNGYQYIAWYDTQGTDQSLWLGRRAVNGVNTGPWERFDTGSNLLNGDESAWDAHNVIALGISPEDGTLHFAWDHHGHTLRYRRSVPGMCSTNLSAWGTNGILPEQNWLVASGQTITSVTYPRFFNTPAGRLRFVYRTGSTAAGDQWLHAYNPIGGAWATGRKFSAKEGVFSDYSVSGGTFTSTSRNAYENGYSYGPDGRLHYTWTYRESTANPSNHDIHYAYSADDGVTWRNNAGAVVADTTLGEAIRVDSPGIIVKVINSRQLLINQQAQCVDQDGRVHVLMLHRRAEPGFEWQSGDGAFSTTDTAYYHYFRDPISGTWSQRRLPLTVSVGSRPKLGFDAQGNLFAVYVGGYAAPAVPGYAPGPLVIASASKASEYTDWEVVQKIDLAFAGEPLLDQARLLQQNLLSVFIQSDSPVTSLVGTDLHVFDFAVNVPEPDPVTLHFSGSDVLFLLSAQLGQTYQLRTTADLNSGSWTNIGNPVPGLNGLLALPDPAGRGQIQRFYQVLQNP